MTWKTIAVYHRARRNKTSLRRRLFASSAFLLLYLVAVLVTSAIINYSVRTEFSAMLQRNERLGSLLTLQSVMWESTQEALRSTDRQSIVRFEQSAGELSVVLEELKRDDRLRDRSRIYLRVIDTMSSYLSESARVLVAREAFAPADYIEISFLSVMQRHLNQQSQELVTLEQQSGMREFAAYYSRVNRRERIAIALLGVFVLVFGALAIRSINRIVLGTERLIEATLAFEDGRMLGPDVPETGYQELDTLAGGFNAMKAEINRHVDDLREKSDLELALQREHAENEQKDRLLKQAQLDFLRSQINPHFLFNTLNIIGKSALLQDAEKSLELIEAISLILRYTLEHDDTLVHLSNELNIVQAYLFIQQTRFGSRLSYHINAPEALRTAKVIPVLLQPLVENSIKFGLEGTAERLRIDVEVSGTADTVSIVVRDDGPGFDPQDPGHGTGTGTGMGIGLTNVRRRMELRYGRDDLLVCRPRPDGGTEVHITVPREE